MKRKVTEYVLYRGRYFIGYSLALALVVGVFVLAALFLPDGLRAEERATAIASGSISFTEFHPDLVVNLPYLLLQRASFVVFGASTLTIKLPSIILGVITIIGLFLLLRQWFHRNVALIAGIIATTIPAMIFVAQDGTPVALMLTLSIWLLLSAIHVTRQHKPAGLWKTLAIILLALNLYVPLGIYLNLAVLTTMIFHPHIRLVMRRMKVHVTVIGAVLGLALIAPLAYAIIMNPSIAETLLGMPESFDSPIKALLSFAGLLFGSYGSAAQPVAPALLSLGILAIVIIGAYRFIKVKHTARSYIIWFWSLTLIPLVYLNQQYINYLLPLVILMIATGIGALIHEWYSMFPLNPYARVVGLVPLTFIVVGLMVSGLTRYEVAYNYTPSIAAQFNNDTKLVEQAIAAADQVGDKKVTVVVNESELPFYELVAEYGGNFTPTSSLDAPTPIIVSGDYEKRSSIKSTPIRIITNRFSENADRFYLYASL